MIVFDTETTGYVKSLESPDRVQPKIIELYALKIDDNTLEEVGELDLLINPREPLSEEIVKVTHITDEMLIGKPAFPQIVNQIQDFWLGERWSAGHNITFDIDVLQVELQRLGLVTKFPWTINRLCTVEASEHYEGRRLNLTALHTHLFGTGFGDAHRAQNDVRATYRCIREMAARGDLGPF